ncbi:GntR family transcriptional regulator [Aquicoccus porphyridii]|uniref:GntR family transcriptional regulator n=1 Tax=Aquicoccus porphyridii TaxID=1852029 RepID=A0A5A9ZGD0_9RHOB|nr:GntR family transcriptional regulator [Aquicoccus porphyridii]KAA0916317.1 GntR family transcriptional regulator [Aquicoccus porphyridii]RAI53556.1 GntR family transcriptional regulator [Rhodobacteraceae bacterium AsT-22]
MADGRVEDIYRWLKARAVSFDLRPGDRINEGTLSREFGVSRTPLREALNRLVSERFFEFRAGQGFFCRGLEAQEIFDLFELRKVLEMAAARAACERASDEGLRALREELFAHGLETRGLSVAEACARDEAFHIGIARLAGNAELTAQLEHINERIRFIRWVEMQARVKRSKKQHVKIMEALEARNANKAARHLGEHIEKRMDQILASVRAGIASIYLDGGDMVQDQVLNEDAA